MSKVVRRSIAASVIATLLVTHNAHGAEPRLAAQAETHFAHASTHEAPSLASVLPFVGLLLTIATFPLIPRTMHWWENNKNRLCVSLSFAAVTLGYYLAAYHAERVSLVLEHAILQEYIPFIVLLFSLYVISGGIRLRGDLAAHPITNTAFLAVGSVIASFVGTTGASMLLIRPLLRTNASRRHVRHTVIFFIFLVSNIGGCLLPIGDPPLFLGYLRGVPFLWTLNLAKAWALAVSVCLLIYYVWDSIAYRHELPPAPTRDRGRTTALGLEGKRNLALLIGVVLCVALVKPGEPLPGAEIVAFPFLRELMMLGLVGLSLLLGDPRVRRDNGFNYYAILEVAALFVGIFITMQPALEILDARAGQLARLLDRPWKFFWITGGLSSFLDNAPTYVVFFQIARSMTVDGGPGALQLAGGGMIRQDILAAVSLGAVFLGAMTYVGNGPNFIVKSIAQQEGVPMPGFFGYMIYSTAILIPLFLVISWVFL